MFFSLPSWAVALIVLAVIGGATAAGYLTGRYLREHRATLREPFGVLQGALLGVVGLILAFGLTLAVGRYEDRRAAAVGEANAIGTTYLRAQLIAEPARTGSLELLEQVRARVAVLKPPAYNRFPNNFSHIFGGGYAAGYYSYKWAEVLSADAYSLFEENGVLDPATGARVRDEVLAVGGARPAAESFRAFRGRDPQVDGLLRHNGMIYA